MLSKYAKKSCSLFFIFFNEKKFWKIQLIFEIEKRLWETELCYTWPFIPSQTNYLEYFYGYFHSPFQRTMVRQCNGEKGNVMATLCAEARSIDQTFLKSHDAQWWSKLYDISSLGAIKSNVIKYVPSLHFFFFLQDFC